MSGLRAVTALLLLSVALATAGDSEPPMTEEEVVRRHVAGASAEALVREIDRREPQFDLSSDMLEELRHAGLPAAVIDAMRERQAAGRPAVVALPEAQAALPPPRLTVTFGPPDGAPAKLSIRRRVDPQLAADWELGNAPEDRVFANLALYLACRTPDHVPDHWRSKSPLGRDFRSMPRHKMLSFLAGSPNAGEGGEGSKVRLELPRAIEVEVQPEVAHDLTLGLAVQVSGRYYSWKHDTRDNLILGDTGLELAATVKGSGLRRLVVEFQE